MQQMRLSTCIYLQKNNQTLFLYRNKKENDFNKGYHIGIGGKIEYGESPEECIKREVKEESNYDLHSMKLIAFVTFVMDDDVEGMFLFTSDDFSGEIKENCDEGILQWIDDDQFDSLNLLEGDRYFFKYFNSNHFVSAKLIYKKNELMKIEEVFY